MADEQERADRQARRNIEQAGRPRLETPISPSQSTSPQKRKRNGAGAPPPDLHTTLGCNPASQVTNPLEMRIKTKARLGPGILDLFPATKGTNGLNRNTEHMHVDEVAGEEDAMDADPQEDDDIETGSETDGEEPPPSGALQQSRGDQAESCRSLDFDDQVFGIPDSQPTAAPEPPFTHSVTPAPTYSDEFSFSCHIGLGFLIDSV